MPALNIVIAGAPGAGKGTQCEKIVEKFGVVHLSTGDIIRAAIKSGSELGKEFKGYTSAGKLVPDTLVLKLVAEAVASDPNCAEKGWLLDGFPRTAVQADAMASMGLTPDLFLLIDVADDVLEERICNRRTDPATGKIYNLVLRPPPPELLDGGTLEQRPDDTKEALVTRLEEYHANVEAVKGSFGAIMTSVDGTAPPDEVTAAVLGVCIAVLGKKSSDVDTPAVDVDKLVSRVIGPAVFLQVLSGSMLFSARQALAMNVFPDAVSLTSFLARLASGGACVEFLLNPIFGKLSDTYGRRRIIPLGSLACMITRAIVFLNPRALWAYVLEQCFGACFITSFFTTWNASLSDLVVGPRLATSRAKAGICAGLGIIAGPILSSRIMNRYGPRQCFLASVVLAALQGLHLLANYPDTLPVSERRPLSFNDMQPLSFLQLFKTRQLSLLMGTTALQTLSEGRNTTDLASIYMQQDLNWCPSLLVIHSPHLCTLGFNSFVRCWQGLAAGESFRVRTRGVARGERRNGEAFDQAARDARPHHLLQPLQRLAVVPVGRTAPARDPAGQGDVRWAHPHHLRREVNRRDVADTWVAFFSRCQPYRC